MRTHDPPPYTAPHERDAARRKAEAERDAFEAALEAKYGPDFEKLPSELRAVLARGVPVHPRQKHARRFDYRVYDRTWRIRTLIEQRRSGHQRNGWRTERRAFLAEVERIRRAEIEVRKMRAVKKGRGKVLPKNVLDQAKNAIEKRELREGAW